uniref:Putative basic tail-containing salivary secreted peptide n=1 Tax=Ochlerotatus triseriatus TaxID=7162 RepID=C6ZQP2_OCHTR
MGTASVIGWSLLVALIIGQVDHSHGVPVDVEGGRTTDDIRIVRLIHYLSYLIDYLVRTYITDWALTSPKEASEYFDQALVAGKQDEAKVDGSKQPYRPDNAKAERTVNVVESISKSKK